MKKNDTDIKLDISTIDSSEILRRIEAINSIEIDPKCEFLLAQFKKSLFYTLLASIAKISVKLENDKKNEKYKDRVRFKAIINRANEGFSRTISFPATYQYLFDSAYSDKNKTKHAKLYEYFCDNIGIDKFKAKSDVMSYQWPLENDKEHTMKLSEFFEGLSKEFTEEIEESLDKCKYYSDILYDDRNNLIHEQKNTGAMPTIQEDQFEYLRLLSYSHKENQNEQRNHWLWVLNIPPSILENLLIKFATLAKGYLVFEDLISNLTQTSIHHSKSTKGS